MTIRRAGFLIAQMVLGGEPLACWLWVIDLRAVTRILGQAQWPLALLAADLWTGNRNSHIETLLAL